MTIDAFRSSQLSGELAELLKNPVLQMALATCDEAAPSNGGVKAYEQAHMVHVQFGVDRGYNLYPKVLKLLATGVEPKHEQVEPEYKLEEEKE